MSAAHTPMVVAAARALCKRESESCGVDEQDNWNTYADGWLADAKAVLDAAGAPELLEALEAYRAARAMPSYGDYAAIPWESKAGPVNPVWGGGDCSKHGRWYGRCHCCAEEWDKLRAQADRDAVHARDNSLRAADEKARAAIAKATGGAQ